jgi:hypothetical protein
MSRFLLLLPLMAALGGCVTTSSSGDVADSNTSTVLLHTSLHDANCFGISMTLTQKDEAGRWVPGKVVTAKGPFEAQQMPSQIVLPPGEYGIANLYCAARKRAFGARIADRPTFWDRSRPVVYEKPIATFKVLPGEVVDIGSLRLPGGVATDRDGVRKSVFIGVVTPMPEAVLRAFAEKDPELYRRRVSRPMTSAVNI